MKRKISAIVFLFAFLFCQSCQEIEIQSTRSAPVQSDSNSDEMQQEFAKILASALNETPELRQFIKEEALRKFDKDYDILYQLVRDESIGGVTFHELLSRHDSNQVLPLIEEKLPLLTIYVPELPDFSAESWNWESEIPKVGVSLIEKKSVPVYNAEGDELIIEHGYIPAFPVLIIKQNERLVINSDKIDTGGRKDQQILRSANGARSFRFVDELFNGMSQSSGSTSTRWTYSLDQKVIDAYFHKVYRGLEWQRDHIYYNLRPSYGPPDPGVTQGKFNNNYSEFITSFKLSTAALNAISDQSGDPILK